MAYVLNKVYEQLSIIWDSRDNRLNHLPFIENPVPMIVLISVYLYVIRNGKKFMEHRKPLNIQGIIVGYNILQIIANSVLFLMITHFMFLSDSGFSFRCQPTDYSNTPNALYQAYLSYAYFILKLADFLDTIFFILRKKTDHVSFLHVYHHVMIALSAYVCVLYATAGQGVLLGYLNSLVHAVMYTYYLLSIWMPSVKSSKLIKRNITKLQMIQFTILVIHFGHGFVFSASECSYPKFLSFLGVTQNLFMIILFSDFYRRAYGRRDTSTSTAKTN